MRHRSRGNPRGKKWTICPIYAQKLEFATHKFPGHQPPDLKAIINGLVRELEKETNARVEADARAFDSEAQLSVTKNTLSQTLTELTSAEDVAKQADTRIKAIETSAAAAYEKGREAGRKERSKQSWTMGAAMVVVIAIAAAFMIWG